MSRTFLTGCHPNSCGSGPKAFGLPVAPVGVTPAAREQTHPAPELEPEQTERTETRSSISVASVCSGKMRFVGPGGCARIRFLPPAPPSAELRRTGAILPLRRTGKPQFGGPAFPV